MRFEEFARSRGLIINEVIPHRWVATPTEDHPRKRNGRYKYMGDYAFVQNWATMERPEVWKSDSPSNPMAVARARQEDAQRRELDAKKAASKAAWILHNCELLHHPYLEAKGFPDQMGNVWVDQERLLVIPMRIDGSLVGAQLINDQGEKKFLRGQRTKGATFIIGSDGIPLLCEGYATALSIRAVMHLIKIRYRIHICFSAGNMEYVAGKIPDCLIIADNDTSGTGQKIAVKTGKPYWLSDTVGEDFNDYHRRVGDFIASQSLKKLLISKANYPLSSGNNVP